MLTLLGLMWIFGLKEDRVVIVNSPAWAVAKNVVVKHEKAATWSGLVRLRWSAIWVMMLTV